MAPREFHQAFKSLPFLLFSSEVDKQPTPSARPRSFEQDGLAAGLRGLLWEGTQAVENAGGNLGILNARPQRDSLIPKRCSLY